jgi:hypothetical protein
MGVPIAVLRELREERKRRLEASRDLASPFLVGMNSGAITPEKIQKEFSAALTKRVSPRLWRGDSQRLTFAGACRSE